MAEYIEKEAAINTMKNAQFEYTSEEAAEFISHINPADVQPVRHGREISNEAHGHIEFKCSLCGCELSTVYGGKNDCGMDGGYFNYCPNCGAKMDGGDQE